MNSRTKDITLKEQWQKARENAERHRSVIIEALIGLAIVIGLIWLGYNVEWTGFRVYQDPVSLEVTRGKTLWDWMTFLMAASVPVTLALLGHRINERRDRINRETEFVRAAESALQNYLDKMTDFLLNQDKGLLRSEPGDEIRDVARARTLTVLPGLDGSRKGMLLRFLYEAKLVRSPAVIELRGANLNNVFLFTADLTGADLRGADLLEANLDWTDLTGANLTGADLSSAHLSLAHLTSTHLVSAHLSWGDLTGADLAGADLTGAELTGAVFSKFTTLPDNTKWTLDADLARFTDPKHPDFWRSDDPNSPAYRGKDEAGEQP